MATTILLPWPPTELWPNRSRRLHWSVRSRVVKAYRADCGWIVRHAEPDMPDEGPIPIRITFCPPTRRSFDLDGALSAIKPGIDGIADATHTNDARYTFVLERGHVQKGGVVEVRIGAPA
jgi:crossover junction endodeoxyribonuclease RusA